MKGDPGALTALGDERSDIERRSLSRDEIRSAVSVHGRRREDFGSYGQASPGPYGQTDNLKPAIRINGKPEDNCRAGRNGNQEKRRANGGSQATLIGTACRFSSAGLRRRGNPLR